MLVHSQHLGLEHRSAGSLHCNAYEPSRQAECKVVLLQLLLWLCWQAGLALHGQLIPRPQTITSVIVTSAMQVLLSADSKEQVISIMEDLSQLKTVPLLQGVLFGR